MLKTSERQRHEVMLRIATMEGIQPPALKDLSEYCSRVLAAATRFASRHWRYQDRGRNDQPDGHGIEASVIESIRNHDADWPKIMDKMLCFDDVLKLDDKPSRLC